MLKIIRQILFKIMILVKETTAMGFYSEGDGLNSKNNQGGEVDEKLLRNHQE